MADCAAAPSGFGPVSAHQAPESTSDDQKRDEFYLR